MTQLAEMTTGRTALDSRPVRLLLPVADAAGVTPLTAAWLLAFSSANTRDAYARDLKQWLEWLATYGQLEPLAVTRGHGDAYARHLEEAAHSRATRARKLSALSSFYEYACDEELIGRNPFKRVNRPNTSTRHGSTPSLTEDEASSLIWAADRYLPDTLNGLRAKAFIRVLCQLGIRLAEGLSINVGDLSVSDGQRRIRITLKGDKEHFRALPADAAAALDRYLLARIASGIDTGPGTPLFPTAKGKRWVRSSAFDTVVRIGKLAGVIVRPHMLRATFITVARDRKVPREDVQRAVGHASSTTTQRYERSREDLRKDPSHIIGAIIAA